MTPRTPWDSPGKNARVGCHFLLEGIFPTQGLNLCPVHCRQTVYYVSHRGSLLTLTKSQINFQSGLNHYLVFSDKTLQTSWPITYKMRIHTHTHTHVCISLGKRSCVCVSVHTRRLTTKEVSVIWVCMKKTCIATEGIFNSYLAGIEEKLHKIDLKFAFACLSGFPRFSRFFKACHLSTRYWVPIPKTFTHY